MKPFGNPQTLRRTAAAVAIDVILLSASVFLAMLARYAPNVPEKIITETSAGLPRVLVSYIGIYAILGKYRLQKKDAEMLSLFKTALSAIVGFGVSFLWEELLKMDLSRRYYLLIVLMFEMGAVCLLRVVTTLLKKDIPARNGEPCVMKVYFQDADHVRLEYRGKSEKCAVSEIAGCVVAGDVTDICIMLPFDDGAFLASVIDNCLKTGCFVKCV